MNMVNWIEALFGSVCLWLSLSVCWRSYRVDKFRHRLFKIRERLMLLVASERLDPDDISYRFLRMAINGMINRAEHFNLLTLILFISAENPPFNAPSVLWKDSVRKLPSETQKELFDLEADVSRAFGAYLISGSVLMMGVVLFIMLKQLFETACRIRVRVAVERAAESAHFSRYENAAYRSAVCDAELAAA